MKKLLSALALLSCASLSNAEVAVIVNSGANVDLSKSDVANIFLGKSKALKGIDQKDWGTTKETFYGAIANKNEAQLKSYWSGLVFTGKGQPLPSVVSDADVIAKVAVESDGIGYVDKASVSDKVKILFTLP